MTPEEIEERRQRIRMKRGLTNNLRTGSYGEDIGAGFANNLMSMGKAADLGGNPFAVLRNLYGDTVPSIPTPMESAFKLVTKKELPKEDSYSLLGIKNEPATNFMENPDVHPTTGGKLQLAGELIPVGANATNVISQLGKKGLKGVANILPAAMKESKNLFGDVFRNDEQALKNLGAITESDVKSSLGKNQSLNPNEAFNIAKGRHDTHVKDVDNKWDVLRGYGEMADYEPTVKFNNKSYLDAVQKRIDELTDLSRHPANADKYATDINFLKRTLEAPTDTFKNAFEHGKSLNKAFRSYIQPGEPVPPSFETVNFLKKAHDQNILENIEKNGLSSTLGDIFNSAKEATKSLHDIYYRIPTLSGKEGKTAFSNMVKNRSANVENFINDFLPSSNKTGVSMFRQLGKMLGNPEEAKKLIISQHFNLGEGIPNIRKFLNKYENISPEQQKFLFPEEFRSKMQLLTGIKNRNPEYIDTKTVKDLWPTILGAMTTHNPVIGGVAGKIIGDTVKNIGTKIGQGDLRNPEVVSQLLQRLNMKELPQANLANTTNIGDQAISLGLKKVMKGKKK